MSATSEGRREEPALVRRLRARQAEHRQKGRAYRAVFVVAGFTVLAAGLAMFVLPGPALIVVPVGLAILSLEFAWAGRLLEKALDKAEEAKESAKGTSTTQRALVGLGCGLAVAAFAVCAILYDIPGLPV